MSNFPVSRGHQIEESMGALLAALVIYLQARWIVPSNSGKVPFLQMGPSLHTILMYILEVGMFEWMLVKIFTFFVCITSHDWGVESGFCTTEYVEMTEK